MPRLPLGCLTALLASLLLCWPIPSYGQDFSIRGEVIDQNTGEPLAGGTVEIEELELRAVTDADGRFAIERIPEGTYTLLARFLGYERAEREITLPEAAGGLVIITLAPDVLAVPDVIVTASPTGRTTTYQPTQAYALEAIQQRSASSFGEMLDGEPGIAMRSFGPAPARPVIRGFDGDRVLVLENGERMGDLSETAHDHNVVLDPLAANRVEVVRGPASLLYGSSAIGGVVNLMTEDIPWEWSEGHSGSLALYGGSVNSSLAGFGRYTYGTAHWAATGRLSYREASDVRTPQGTLPGTSIRNVEGSSGFGYQEDSFSAGLAFIALDHHFGLPDEIDDPNAQAEIKLNRQALQGRAEGHTSGFFRQYEVRLHAAHFSQEEIATEPLGGTTHREIPLAFSQHAGNATLTLQHGPIGVLDEGALGISIHGRSLGVGGTEAFTPGIRNGSLALFTFQEFPLQASASLQFGARVERQELAALSNSGFPDERRTRSSTAYSGSIGLNLRPLNTVEVGLQVARAHRFPMLEELYADGIHFGAGVYEEGNPALRDEIGLGSDLFVRWNTRRIALEMAIFYTRINNFIAFQPTGTVFIDDQERPWEIFRYEAHDAEMLGGEASLAVLLTEALEVGAGLDYVQGTRLDGAGTPLPTIPPLRTRFDVRFDPGPWWLGSTLRLVDAQERVAPEEDPTAGYTLLDLLAGYRLDRGGRHSLILRLDNATNVLYRDHLSRVDRTEFGAPMPGRNLNVMYRWLF